MGKARDEAGNIWETDAQGNPVRMIQPAQSNPMNNPFVDPRLQYQVRAAQGQAAAAPFEGPKAASDAAAASAQARIAEANANVANAKNGADLQKAQLELEKLRLELANTQTGKGSALNALQTQVDRVGELYRQNLQGGVPNFLNDVIPDFLQSDKGQFDAAAQGLTNPFQSAFKVQGQGSQSDTELRQFIEANVPKQGDSDAVIQEKLGNIQTRINAERGNAGQQPPPPPPPGDPMAIATGGTRDEIDPALKATGQKVGQMIAKGVPDAVIVDFLQKSGVNPADTSVGQALKFRKSKDFQTWQRQNPGAAYPIGPNFYTKQVPMTDARSLFNKTAATDLGGAAAAYGASAGNAILGGRIDNLSGNPAMAQTGMELLRSKHPFLSLGGDVAGQALVEGSIGRIPGAQALMASRWGRRAADAGYGAYSGSGEGDGSLLSAAEGAAANLGGGMLGRSAQRGVGRALTGVKNADLGYLDKRGIDLTLGQIASGSNNVLGEAIGGVENRIAGLSGMDAVIGEARQRGDRGFNRAMFEDVAGPQGYPSSGRIGAEGLLDSKAAKTAAYGKLNGVRMGVDPAFDSGVSVAQTAGNGLHRHAADINSVIGDVRAQIANGEMSGEGFQSALQSIREARASLGNDVMGHKAANVLTGLENEVLALGSRQGGSIASDLANANAIHSKREIIKTAMKGAPSLRNGQMVSPMALDQAAVRNTEKFGGLDQALSTNRPFYELTSAAKNVMPNLTPDSGTAGRLAVLGALSSAGAGLGGIVGAAGNEDDRFGGGASGGLHGLEGGALLGLALSAPYTKSGQKIIQRALLGKRPRQIDRIGEYLINNPQFGGMFGGGRLGSASARDFFYQPELGQ